MLEALPPWQLAAASLAAAFYSSSPSESQECHLRLVREKMDSGRTKVMYL
jgi:hypothetical protein